MALAKKTGKPALLYFDGYQCVNCRKMEDLVWPQPEVFTLLKNDFVIIALPVDDKQLLPDGELGQKNKSGREIKTYGAKWFDLQVTRYKNATQPLFAILDHKGKDLTETASYETHHDPGRFADWLRKGLKAFEAVQ